MNVIASMQSAVAQGVLWGIMAIGVFITFRVMKFSDLTVDGSFATGACISIALVLASDSSNSFVRLLGNPWVSLLVASVGGTIAGMLTGFLHTKMKIAGILSSILTMIALYSVNLRILGKGNVSIMKKATVFTMISDNLPISPNMVMLLVGAILTVIIIVGLYWFFGTEIGSALRATGNNENMAKALGVNIDSIKIMGLALSNALVAFAGALVGQSQRYADVTMGAGTIVIGLASVVIGGVLVGNRANFAVSLIGTSLGSIVYRVVVAIVLQLGLIKTDDQKIFTAIIVAIALSVPTFTEKINLYKKQKEAK